MLFTIIHKVGEGTYGKVYKASYNNNLYALKRIRIEYEKEGFPLTSMREIRLLQLLSHPNILSISDIISDKYIYMVFEYASYDLTGILSHPSIQLSESEIKCIIIQILKGLEYLHYNCIIHRDIKGSNILIDKNGVVKLADFGLAKIFSQVRAKDSTNRVITLWYRPPELLLGATEYSYEVDIWSVGCIVVEMYTRRALFTGTDEISQLESILRVLLSGSGEVGSGHVGSGEVGSGHVGSSSKDSNVATTTPNNNNTTPNNMESLSNLQWYSMMMSSININTTTTTTSTTNISSLPAYPLIISLLQLDPAKRSSAKEALECEYFYTEPLACKESEIRLPEGEWHEYESKRRDRGAATTTTTAAAATERK